MFKFLHGLQSRKDIKELLCQISIMEHAGSDKRKLKPRKKRRDGEFSFTDDLRLGSGMRKELSGDFGRIMDGRQIARSIGKDRIIYSVGDVTTATLLELGYKPKISIFDYRAEKEAAKFPIIERVYKDPVRVRNGRGELSAEMWEAVRDACRKAARVGIRVYGEEDLASLACIYFAKIGEFVVYGMRGRGMAVVKVTREMKDYVEDVVTRMAGISKDY